MSDLLDVLRASEPLLPDPCRAEAARLFAEDEHLARLAARLLALQRDGVPPTPPPPHFAAEVTPPLESAFAFFRAPLAAWLAGAPDLPAAFARAFAEAGLSNLLLLLGQRRTPASLTDARAIPPSRARLLASAGAAHAGGPLTVAGRALSKHASRSSDDFWPEPRGPVAAINAAALSLVEHLLDQATWWNVFGHFQHETVFEARVAGGHGARWGRQGEELVGFLEPFGEGRCPSLGAAVENV